MLCTHKPRAQQHPRHSGHSSMELFGDDHWEQVDMPGQRRLTLCRLISVVAVVHVFVLEKRYPLL